jgi:hypothetical protein
MAFFVFLENLFIQGLGLFSSVFRLYHLTIMNNNQNKGWLKMNVSDKGKIKQLDTEQIRQEIETALDKKPYVFRTDKTRKAIDGCSAGVLANMDCVETGPKESIMVGRKRAYVKSSYIEWAISRISQVK